MGSKSAFVINLTGVVSLRINANLAVRTEIFVLEAFVDVDECDQ